jgi:hypothetical protein
MTENGQWGLRDVALLASQDFSRRIVVLKFLICSLEFKPWFLSVPSNTPARIGSSHKPECEKAVSKLHVSTKKTAEVRIMWGGFKVGDTRYHI